jgi:CCR4-NOT complex subunit CAF16
VRDPSSFTECIPSSHTTPPRPSLLRADLDLITRQDFLSYLKVTAEQTGLTIVYATHIFDGLDDWASHIGYIANGEMRKYGEVDSFTDLVARRDAKAVAPLLRTIESWLREDRNVRVKAGQKITEEAERLGKDELRGDAGNGYLSGRFNNGFN